MSEKIMRAKLKINSVRKFEDMETLSLRAVGKSDGYPDDGSDENNTFAKWTPAVEMEIHVTNPNLIGKFHPGETFYVDFTKTDS